MELRLITQRKYKSALIRVIVMNNNSKDLIERNMEGLEKRQEWFADAVRAIFTCHLILIYYQSKRKQVSVFRFSSGKYDLDLGK